MVRSIQALVLGATEQHDAVLLDDGERAGQDIRWVTEDGISFSSRRSLTAVSFRRGLPWRGPRRPGVVAPPISAPARRAGT